MSVTLPPVALLHGWGGSFASTFAASGWRCALAEAGRTVIAADLPGHGEKASRNSVDYSDLAADLDARLPPGPLDVVGYSLGGKLALAIASRNPNRFRRLVIGGVGDNLFAPEPVATALADALDLGVGPDTPEQLKALIQYATADGNDPLALAAVLRRPPNPVLADRNLAGLAAVLLVNGAEDRIALPDQRLRDAMPQASYVSLAGTDHLSLASAPKFMAAALKFLGVRGRRDGGSYPQASTSASTQFAG